MHPTEQRPLPYVVESVSFADDQFTIVYYQPEDDTPLVQEVKTLMFRPLPEVVEPELVDAILRMLCDVIDDVHVAKRNTPDRLR